jgi:hypothetical protein
MARPTIYHVKLSFNGQLWHHFWCSEIRESGRSVTFSNRQVPRIERQRMGYNTRSIGLSPLTIMLERIAYYAYPQPAPDWFFSSKSSDSLSS